MPVNPFLMTTSGVARKSISASLKPMPRRGLSGSSRLVTRFLLLVPNCLGFLSRQLPTCRYSLALSATTRKLGFLSFDLDDTLFPTSTVVNEANHRMIDMLAQLGFATDLPSVLSTTREIRSSLTSPMTYTGLRKRAIETEMKRTQPDRYSADLVQEVYQAWEMERHAAAERHLFRDALDMLESMRTVHPDVCIAAITNGKGNPLHMPSTLAPYFAFCVSGEDDEVFPHRKPHAGIYNVSSDRYRQLYPHHGEDHVWCHVGDCLANDVGASAACGALAVWLAPDESSVESAAARLGPTMRQPSWSTASEDDLSRRAELANQAKERVATRISRLSELSAAVAQLVAGTGVGATAERN